MTDIYSVKFSKSAYKQLAKMPRNIIVRLGPGLRTLVIRVYLRFERERVIMTSF